MLHETDILRANLARLRRTEPALAERLLATEPAPLRWEPSRAGPLTAAIERDGKVLSLASRYDPAAEAAKLVAEVDPSKHGGVFLLGVGLGYHVADVARRLSEMSILVAFEADLALLRAVLERIDHTAWLGRHNVLLIDPAVDRGEFLNRVERFGSIITQGTLLITHPPSRQLHAQAIAGFGQMITDVLAYCRTNVATALVNSARTIENLARNLPHYVAGAGTNEIFNVARGYPAVCVGAGPSLARNVHLLQDPAVRRNVVVISAQTTLKPLLDRGIEPDFVTALDYHEISRRFYEGLPALPRVTLVAEPKANPAILDSFPGPIRTTQNPFLDKLLGDLATPLIPIRPGTTVAHLSFYLAQHLGCDPIIMIGQDLGFSDGLYYCPGTAIHDVWAPELGPFNTLEMMEWQRIVRHRGHLHKLDDIHGRPIYSDEQMVTYLKQFERDFVAAPQQVIDASEGGLPKQNTVRMTLAAALAQHATRPAPPLPRPPAGRAALDAGRIAAAAKLLERRIDEVKRLRNLTEDTVPLLRQMSEHQKDASRNDRLFQKIERNKQRVMALGEVFDMVNELNTVGAFKRSRADRAIKHESTSDATGVEVQRRQIERDLENLDWLLQTCDETTRIFAEALTRVRSFQDNGSTKKTRVAPEPQPLAV